MKKFPFVKFWSSITEKYTPLFEKVIKATSLFSWYISLMAIYGSTMCKHFTYSSVWENMLCFIGWLFLVSPWCLQSFLFYFLMWQIPIDTTHMTKSLLKSSEVFKCVHVSWYQNGGEPLAYKKQCLKYFAFSLSKRAIENGILWLYKFSNVTNPLWSATVYNSIVNICLVGHTMWCIGLSGHFKWPQ